MTASRLVALLLAAACRRDVPGERPPCPEPAPPPVFPALAGWSDAQLRAAPETVRAGGSALRATAWAGIDLNPGISHDDAGCPLPPRTLGWHVTLSSVAGTALPASVDADAAWVLSGDDVWATYVQVYPGGAAGASERLYDGLHSDGPRGFSDSAVVVLRLIDRSSGRWHLLRAPSTRVQTTM